MNDPLPFIQLPRSNSTEPETPCEVQPVSWIAENARERKQYEKAIQIARKKGEKVWSVGVITLNHIEVVTDQEWIARGNKLDRFPPMV